MRLLKLGTDGAFSLVSFSGDRIPPYAILSHTWGADNDEVTFDDVMSNRGQSKCGYQKLLFCQKQASINALEYSWVDTCCIDKSSSQELSEAINSMFRWYERSTRCYVYLTDVSTGMVKDLDFSTQALWKSSFRHSRWFTRGWTLQELLAPKQVDFFSMEGRQLGNKLSLEKDIHDVTGIPNEALHGRPLWQFGVEERFSWAKVRKTGREEDTAYCLLGIFGVCMNLNYSEGRANAFDRLQRKVRKLLERSVPTTCTTSNEIRANERLQIAPGPSRCGISNMKPHKFAKIKKSIEDKCKQREKLLKLLEFEQIGSRRETVQDAHGKTCEWFLEETEFTAWLDPLMMQEHHGLLWIKGKAGCGKSTLMKFVITHFLKNLRDWTVLSFFFNARGVELERSTMGMYRSLLFQLLQNIPELQLWFSSVMSEGSTSFNFRWTLASLESLLLNAVQNLINKPVVCFVDALDESDEAEIRDMISCFENIGQQAVNKRIPFLVCFSSRYYPHITITKHIPMELDGQSGHSQDIANYLFSKLKIGSGDLAHEIRQELQQRAAGVFLWVVLVKDILNKAYDSGRQHELRRKLHEIPQDLNRVFHDILTRDHYNEVEMILCIQWVLFSEEPLTPKQLYHAILAGISTEDVFEWHHDLEANAVAEKFVLDCSKGLTEITGPEMKTVQFIHESVRAFFLKQNSIGRICSDLTTQFEYKSNLRLNHCCQSYLSMASLQSWIPREGIPESLDERKALLKDITYAFPLIRYAVVYGLFHAERAAAKVSQKDFICSYAIGIWPSIYCLFCHSFKYVCGHNFTISYILIEKRLPNLLSLLEPEESPLKQSDGQWKCALFVALAQATPEMTRILLTAYTTYRRIANLPSKFFDTEEWCGNFRPPSVLPGNQSIWSYMDEFCHPEICNLFDGERPSDSLDRKDDWDNRIVRALTSSNWAFASWLISRAPSFPGRGKTFNTALIISCKLNISKLIHQLLQKGVDVNTADDNLVNPLYIAIYHGNKQIVQSLLDTGANVNFKDEIWGSPLQAAIQLKVSSQIIQLLLEKGARVDAQGVHYVNALEAALAYNASEKVVQLLLHHGADMKAQNRYFGNALGAACIYRTSERNLQLLLDQGADVNSYGGYYGTPLQAASYIGDEKLVQLLLKNGANVNAYGGHYGYALQAALSQRNEQIVHLLLNNGADVSSLRWP